MVRSTLPPFAPASTWLGGVDLAFSDLERWVNIFNFERDPNRKLWADFKMVRSTLPPFGPASKSPGGVEMAFADLKRWVKFFNLEPNPHRNQWADFKKKQSEGILIYIVLSFSARARASGARNTQRPAQISTHLGVKMVKF